jgi:CheY-like chemotaxis protein
MSRLKILVIDDDSTTCHLIETILHMEGYETASTNVIANEDIISLLNQEQPDILILDFHLGSDETLEHVATIRKGEKWSSLPVIMTSGINRQQDCRAAGASDFVLKPFNWQDMTKIVNRIGDILGR